MQSHFGFKVRVSIGFFRLFFHYIEMVLHWDVCYIVDKDFQISSHNLFYQSCKNKDLSSFQTLTLIKKKKKENVQSHGKQVRNVRKEWTRNKRASLILCKWCGESAVVWAKWSFWVSLCCIEFLWEMKKIMFMKYKIRKCKTKAK